MKRLLFYSDYWKEKYIDNVDYFAQACDDVFDTWANRTRHGTIAEQYFFDALELIYSNVAPADLSRIFLESVVDIVDRAEHDNLLVPSGDLNGTPLNHARAYRARGYAKFLLAQDGRSDLVNALRCLCMHISQANSSGVQFECQLVAAARLAIILNDQLSLQSIAPHLAKCKVFVDEAKYIVQLPTLNLASLLPDPKDLGILDKYLNPTTVFQHYNEVHIARFEYIVILDLVNMPVYDLCHVFESLFA